MKFLYTLFIAVLPLISIAQYDFDEAYFYPEAMQEDLKQFVEVVKKVHPDPWRYISEKEFDSMAEEIRLSLDRSLSLYRYMDRIQPLIRSIGDAHTTMSLPEEFAFSSGRKVPLIPIKVCLEGERMFLTNELKAFRTLESGVEILSINNIKAATIIEKMRACISVDGLNTSFADFVISTQFPLVFHRAVQRAESFSIRYKLDDGSEKLAQLKALTRSEMERSGRMPHHERKALQWTSEAVEDGKCLWLRIPTLSLSSIIAEGIRPDRILKDAKKLLSAPETEVLIVDLRGTSGMEMELVKDIYELFATSPYRALSNIMVRSFEVPFGISHDGFPESDLDALKERCVEGVKGFQLSTKDAAVALNSPDKDPFTGQVFVITDGGTTEAATALTMMARRDQRGTIIGNETGSNATSFCAGKSLVYAARKTGVRFAIPIVKYELDRGANAVSLSGVKPDIHVYMRVEDRDQADAAFERDLLMFIGEWE